MKRSLSDITKERGASQIKKQEEELELYETQAEGYAAEYAEVCDTWKQIDSKAQITASVSGIFLGGIFALQRLPQTALPPADKWLLALALALLVGSIICAVQCLWLRDIVFPPRGTMSADAFRDLLATAEFGAGGLARIERVRRFGHDLLMSWQTANSSALETINSKGTWAIAAQVLFAFGALIFAGLSIYEMFGKTTLLVPLGGV